MKKVLLVVMASLMLVSMSFAALGNFENTVPSVNSDLEFKVEAMMNFYNMGLTSGQASNLYNYLVNTRVKIFTINTKINDTLKDTESDLLGGDSSGFTSAMASIESYKASIESMYNDVFATANEILTTEQVNALEEFVDCCDEELAELILSETFVDLLGDYVNAL